MDPRAAHRYARALFSAARQTNTVREAEEDLEAICKILEAKPDFKKTLEAPKISREQKLKLVDRVFADRARPLTMRLLRLLIEKHREQEIPLIYKDYVRLREESEGILRVIISSAKPISDNELRKLIAALEKRTGKSILYETVVDPKLIGGVAVRYGDDVLDGTVQGALRRLKEHLYYDVLKQT
ncbi:MAG TPA: F0F1 ATP synthase subunit delta [Fimbriimonadales bacterium]|nr:F0F1 ATP synthase subunit delta [Fimbriimonadales bacterium]